MAAVFGNSVTQKFMLGSASILLGPQTSFHNLTRANHNLGMVKNFRLETKPGFADLTQGTKNSIVFSTMNANAATGSAELYEYTTRNLTILAGASGSELAATPNDETILIDGGIAANDTSFTQKSTTVFTLALNDWVLIRDPLNEDDGVIRQITNIVGRIYTVNVPFGRSFSSVGTIVRRMNFIPLVGRTDPGFYSMIVNGQMADGSEASIGIPKVRITSGINMGFQTNDYGNLPFTFEVMDTVAGDVGYTALSGAPVALLV